MALQRHDIPFLGIRTNHSEVCVLYDIDRKNKMFSGRAWNIKTGFSTPFLDVDYRVKFRHFMRVHFLPDGSACGYEAISLPDWRVCEGRESGSEIEQVKVSGLLPRGGHYHKDEKGEIFDSPIGAIRMSPLMCSIAEYDRLEKVIVSPLPRPEIFKGKTIFWEGTDFLDTEQPGHLKPSEPENRLHKQLFRMKELLKFGQPIVSCIRDHANYMQDRLYEDMEIFIENCKDILNEAVDYCSSPDEVEELIWDSIRTQDLGVKILGYFLDNCKKSLQQKDAEKYDTYIKMKKELSSTFFSTSWIVMAMNGVPFQAVNTWPNTHFYTYPIIQQNNGKSDAVAGNA
ncbi:unnamed protein product [Caenorhabditis brenneri]